MNTLDTLTEFLLQHARTVTCAESCTGGLLAAEFTRTSGSSAWFDMGFVTYSNTAKQEMLLVPETVLAEHGAVSEAVARAMAEGALRAARAHVAVALSGIAGPDGGTADKPVGLVWIAWSRQLPGEETPVTIARSCQFAGDRILVREQAILTALQGICDFIQ